jgi:hypothetical protein
MGIYFAMPGVKTQSLYSFVRVWASLDRWDGLEVPVITFLAILAAPPGLAACDPARLAKKNIFDKFFLPK